MRDQRKTFYAAREVIRTQCPPMTVHDVARAARAATETGLIMFTADGRARIYVEQPHE